MNTSQVHAPSPDVHEHMHALHEPHPGAWNDTVYVVVSHAGVHWIGRTKAAADIMTDAVPDSRVVTMETGTAYVEGR